MKPRKPKGPRGPKGPGGPRKPPQQDRSQRNRVVTPTGWLSRGEAVVGGDKPLVVWGGIPGEAALVHVHHRGQNRDRSRWLETDDPSPNRRTPECEKFDRCGGCPIMHLDVAGQRDARLQIVDDLFRAQGLEAHVPTKIVASPDGDLDYRHVMKLVVGQSDWGRTRLGAYGRDSHDVVAIPECHVVTETLREASRLIAHHVIDLDVFPYDEKTGKGVLRHVVVRQSRRTGELLVTLVAARNTMILDTLGNRLADTISSVAGVHLHLNSAPGNAIFHYDEGGVGTIRIVGKRAIEDELAGVVFQVGPGDFFQANPGTADRLIRDVVSDLRDFRDRPVLDLYCGVGAFTIPLAKEHTWAAGIEVVRGAVNRAKETTRQQRAPAEFFAGPVEERLPEVAERVRGAAPVVVIDPSRRGLEEEVIELITDLEASRLVYISCNPSALARDLKELTGRGWSVQGIRAYDMFPQTSHVEMVAMLAPANAPEAPRASPRRRLVR